MLTGLGAFVLILSLVNPEAGEGGSLLTLYDFSTRATTGRWRTVNDDVMGGVSHGKLRLSVECKRLEFFGSLSLKNSGGFASVRSFGETHDLSEFTGLALRVRGDGRRYSVNVRTDQIPYGGSYRAELQTRKGEWITLRVPFASFVATFHGRLLKEAPPLDRRDVQSVGVTLSDRREGPFKLELDWVKAYKETVPERPETPAESPESKVTPEAVDSD